MSAPEYQSTCNPLKDHACRVMSNTNVGNNLYLMTLKPVDSAFTCLPGQFVMINLPTNQFFLRRPMSVLSTNSDGSFSIYYKVHGTGTTMLSGLKGETVLNILGPLGNTFTTPKTTETALLIGGGIGIAPMYFWGQYLKQHYGQTPHCLYGIRSQQELGIFDRLSDVFEEKLHVSTDDGSTGFNGNVCQLLQSQPELITQAKEAYICGPTPMMKAVCNLLRTTNPTITIQVSLEEMMPCGTGACSGCVIFRQDQILPSKTCVEGPIFNDTSIYWPGEEQQKTQQEAPPCPA